MTVFLTTHYMEEADHICNRVAIMDGGKIVAMDTPHRLRSQIGDPEKVTLEDVFLNATGKALREEAGTFKDTMRIMRKAWGGIRR